MTSHKLLYPLTKFKKSVTIVKSIFNTKGSKNIYKSVQNNTLILGGGGNGTAIDLLMIPFMYFFWPQSVYINHGRKWGMHHFRVWLAVLIAEPALFVGRCVLSLFVESLQNLHPAYGVRGP